MKPKAKPEKFEPPPEEGLTFEEAMKRIATVPKKVVDDMMKEAKKKRKREK